MPYRDKHNIWQNINIFLQCFYENYGKIWKKMLTKMVSLAGFSSSKSISISGVPSKLFKCVRMRFSSPCLAKCRPSIEYQCSNSAGDWMAAQVWIWFSMNDNRAACFHGIFRLQFEKEVYKVKQSFGNDLDVVRLTNLAKSVHSFVVVVLLTGSSRAGIFSWFYVDYLALLKFQAE